MGCVQSPVFATYTRRITGFLFWFLLLARVEAQNRTYEVDILAMWKYQIFPHYDGAYVHPGGYFSTWNFGDENACAWAGVSCTANFTVEELDLSGWKLPGLQLQILSGLKDLRFLDLSSSNVDLFTDASIGDEIGLLTRLTHLDISQSGLQGSIPGNISSCISLRYLSLKQNQLSGEIPRLHPLVNLQVLLLANNNFSGQFPKGLSGFLSLVELDLSDNQLIGTIPSLTNFPRLVDLKLDTNMFTAFEEPLSSSKKNSLQRLSVSDNRLGGMIPPNITKLLGLTTLNMSRNRLVGNIPSGFRHLYYGGLTSVDLSLNNLSGNIPADFLQPSIYKPGVFINASYNFLSGSLPLDDSKLYRFDKLDLSHNQLSGPVPLMLNGRGNGMESLWLQNNQLSGDIVDVLVHVAFYRSVREMSELRLDNNRFTGDLAKMIGLWQTLYLNVVGLSNNFLQMTSTEGIPDPLGATLQSFQYQPSDSSISMQLYLGGNNFSGASLPMACFGNTLYFEVLDLSSNSLDGEILGGVFNQECLPQLRFLNLSNNRVRGPVPQSILTLPNLEVLDISRNNLSGRLPAIQLSSPLYDPRIFANNTGLCGDPLPPCPSNSTLPIVHSTGVQWWVVLIIVAVSVMGVVGSCMIATWRWKVYYARHQQDADLIKTLMEREVATLMPLRELKKATENFAESAQVGEGGFGAVYVGKLSDGTRVAIKRSKREGSKQDKEQFLNEVKILSQVNHRFLVKLLGCCMENKIALLVFEFVPNGTLQDHLRRKIGNAPLSWKQRLNISVQTADALSYLHTATTFPIYHRDVKSTNILLDEDCHAKVADFGISKLAPIRATHISTVAVQGTMGYIDPEYYTSFQLTSKSDVYSFGVVLLELITAKPVIDFLRGGEETSLVYFSKPHIDQGDLEPMIDPTLMETYNDLAGGGRDSILNVGRLAMKCLDMRSKARPNMSEVLQELQNLWVNFNGAPGQLASINVDESEAPLYDNCLPFEYFSDDGAGFTIQNDVGSVQMSPLPR